MSAVLEATRPAGQTKTFGKSTREVPHHSQKARKYYPAEDEAVARKVCARHIQEEENWEEMATAQLQSSQSSAEILRLELPQAVRKSIRTSAPRPSLTPGTILILLAGRFRGKRVVLLNTLDQGVLLVTGPFKINGVPLRRVNARYVIATSQKVDLSGIDKKKIEEASDVKYFAVAKDEKKNSEEAFFAQGEKPEKKKPSTSRAADQKSIDKALLSNIKKEPMLASYLASTFSLRKGDRPHEMAW
ncbi:putative 60S ribosomal protein L6-B [Cadophora sp. MPI-SDFR-AT-0126]|nr:putative 60S ribosomal protein L6-B [Leotiomycetes sp. MPI-SDFR-AT-0126]